MTAPALRPPFPYYGGKTTLAPRIVNLLPDHKHYVEPFAGGLSVLLAKAPSPMETVNDLDGQLMTFWRVLRERPAELVEVCALTPHSRREHELAYDRDTDDELEVARRVWVSLTQGRGGTLRRTGWRHFQATGDRRGPGMPDTLTSYVERMRGVAARLAEVSLECRDALQVVGDYGRHAEVLLYVDPPYQGSVRSSRQYLVEMSQDSEHEALAEALHGCKAAVVLSGYDSPLYAALYAGWHRTELATRTAQGNHGTGTHSRTEVLWSNRTVTP